QRVAVTVDSTVKCEIARSHHVRVVINYGTWLILLSVKRDRNELNVVHLNGVPVRHLADIVKAQRSQGLDHGRIEGRGDVQLGDKHGHILVEPQQRLEVAVIPVTVRAADTGQGQPHDVAKGRGMS